MTDKLEGCPGEEDLIRQMRSAGYSVWADKVSTLSAEREAMEGALKKIVEGTTRRLSVFDDRVIDLSADEVNLIAKAALQHKGETDEQG